MKWKLTLLGSLSLLAGINAAHANIERKTASQIQCDLKPEYHTNTWGKVILKPNESGLYSLIVNPPRYPNGEVEIGFANKNLVGLISDSMYCGKEELDLKRTICRGVYKDGSEDVQFVYETHNAPPPKNWLTSQMSIKGPYTMDYYQRGGCEIVTR